MGQSCSCGFSSDLRKTPSLRESYAVPDGGAGETVINGIRCTKLNDSVYELYRPDESQIGKPQMEIVFFHGLRLDNYRTACVDTWMSTSEPSECWIKTWLPGEFARSRVLTVSYDSCVSLGPSYGRFDLYLTAEQLARDLISAGVGQEYGTPLVLVGHCLGGLLIKKLCCYVGHNDCKLNKEARENFIANMVGGFFIATPQVGMNLKPIRNPSPLFKILQQLEETTSRLNKEFEELRRAGDWLLEGLGASAAMQSPGLLEDLFVEGVVAVQEASYRPNLDKFSLIAEADHSSIGKPRDQQSSVCCRLFDFLKDALKKATFKYQPRNPWELQLPHILIGVDKHLIQLEILMKCDQISGISIWGMGGLGKTTLAKAMFKKMSSAFDYVSYVERSDYAVDSKPFTKETLEQNHLYRNGRKVSRESLRLDLSSKTLLFIVDDLRFADLAPTGKSPLKVWDEILRTTRRTGCRTLITTRDREVLRGLEKTVGIINTYKMTALDQDESYELLVKHAFPQSDHDEDGNEDILPAALSRYVDPEYPSRPENLVAKVARLCEGLPLALVVIGGVLRGQGRPDAWLDARGKLNEAGLSQEIEERVRKILKVSYDGLSDHMKEMFLDAATVFNGLSLYSAQAAWDTWKASASSKNAWKTLIDMSLVYGASQKEIEEENAIIRMHEQLRSLGRDISEKQTEIRYGQRIWQSKKAWEFIIDEIRDESRGLEGICGFRFHFSELPFKQRSFLKVDLARSGLETPTISANCKVVQISGSLFQKMTQLRYLILDGVDIAVGSSRKEKAIFSNRLVLLNWSSGARWSDLSALSRPIDTCHLSVLHLKCVELQSLDDLMNGRFLSLKIVELRSARRLDKIPQNIDDMQRLERLKFLRCHHLREIPASLGKLKHLTHLVLWDCKNVQALPEFILPRLQQLILAGCSSLTHLPKFIGTSDSLHVVDLHRCRELKGLPQSISNLSKLKSLRISGSFQNLPDGFGTRFPALKQLQIMYCKNLEFIPPEALASCSDLQQLTILRCHKLGTLPGVETFKGLKNLRRVRVGWVATKKSELHDLGKLWKESRVDYNVRGHIGPGIAASSFKDEDADFDTISVDYDYWRPEGDCEDDEVLSRIQGKDEPSVSSEISAVPEPESFVATHANIKGEHMNHLYLVLESVHEHLQRIEITIESHDQGYSSFPSTCKGTEHCTNSFGELVIRDPAKVEIARTVIFKNLHAISQWQTHRCIIEEEQFLTQVKKGYVVEVWTRSQYLAWQTYVSCGSLELVRSQNNITHEAVTASYDWRNLGIVENHHDTEITEASHFQGVKADYVRMLCRWQSLKRICVEIDSKIDFMNDQIHHNCIKTIWGPVWSDKGVSNWSCNGFRVEMRVIDTNGKEVGERIQLDRNIFSVGFGLHRHTYLIEDESSLSRIKEGYTLVLWIEPLPATQTYHRCICSWSLHVGIQRARIHLIPTEDLILRQDLPLVFPKVVTRQGVQKGRCCNYLYLVYQSPFETVGKIKLEVEAREYPLGKAKDPNLISHFRELLSALKNQELVSQMIDIVKMKQTDLSNQVKFFEIQEEIRRIIEIKVPTTSSSEEQTEATNSRADEICSSQAKSNRQILPKTLLEGLSGSLSWGELNLLVREHARLQEGNQEAESLLYMNQTDTGSTWGELGVLTAEGIEEGERVVVFNNIPHHLSKMWRKHEYTVDQQRHGEFLSSIRKGYRVALWLRSGPGWYEEQVKREPAFHCARYASMELVPDGDVDFPPQKKKQEMEWDSGQRTFELAMVE